MATATEIQATSDNYNEKVNYLKDVLDGTDNTTLPANATKVYELEEKNKRKTGKAWSDTEEYKEGDMVSHTDKNLYVCVQDNLNKNVSDTTYWRLLTINSNSGFYPIAGAFVKYVHDGDHTAAFHSESMFNCTVDRNSDYSTQVDLDASIVDDNTYIVVVTGSYANTGDEILYSDIYDKDANKFIVHFSRKSTRNEKLNKYIDMDISIYKEVV